MDETDPSIVFDRQGVCNYVYSSRRRLETECFRGEEGNSRLAELVKEIKAAGRRKPYDCIVGVSGGVDSSYLLVRAKELGLRPLAVHLDNGWNSELAVANIERLLRALDIDLHTHVVNWEEIKDLQRAFFLASMSNVEVVTDHAIVALLYQEAHRNKVRYILSGSNVETESIMPDAWGYDPRDAKHILAIHREYGIRSRLETYPLLPAHLFLRYIFVNKIRHIPLLNYGRFHKADAINQLRDEFGWVPYARKHGESRFTRFFQEYYLPKKFGFDKRKPHLSSLILSGQISREQALLELTKPLYEPHEETLELEYVTKKLGFSQSQWETIMTTPEKSYREFANNSWMFDHSSPVTQFVRQIAKGERPHPRLSTPLNNRPAKVRSSSDERLICHVGFSSFRNESRALRATNSALQFGLVDRVLFVGYHEPGIPRREPWRPGAETVRLSRPEVRRVPRLLLRSAQWVVWSLRAVSAIGRLKLVAIQCHSLASLPAGVAIKRIAKVPLVYDAHELETERAGWGRVQKAMARLIERILIRHSDHTFAVSQSIVSWYADRYHLDSVSLLRNVPIRPPAPVAIPNRLLRNAVGIADEDLIFIYLGIVDAGRGYRQLIDAFRGLSSNCHLVFLGSLANPEVEREVLAATHELRNIHWHPAVPNERVVEYASGADVGIALIEDVCLSYRYCLPNKVHECRLAGLPVIVSNLPEMARFIDETMSGWKVAPDAQSLRTLVESLDRAQIQQKLESCTAPALTWDEEQGEYLRVLQQVISKKN
jgi:N-acetyl sugar amidotransferase